MREGEIGWLSSQRVRENGAKGRREKLVPGNSLNPFLWIAASSIYQQNMGQHREHHHYSSITRNGINGPGSESCLLLTTVTCLLLLSYLKNIPFYGQEEAL